MESGVPRDWKALGTSSHGVSSSRALSSLRDDPGEDGGPWGTDPFPFPPVELKATGTAHFFNFLLNSSDYRILLKDEDHDRMYVGSKDYVLSLDLHDINREPLIVSCQHRAGGSEWKGVIGHFGGFLDARARTRWA